MSKCVLVQANGDGVRMRNYFDMPKHHLYYKGARIIDRILEYTKSAGVECFVASKYTEDASMNVIRIDKTNNRLHTLLKSIHYITTYDTIIIHDCDVLFNKEVIADMQGDMIAITNYKGDGLKYGFIDVTQNLQYKSGNEKICEAPYITTGLYSIDTQSMLEYMKDNDVTTIDSILHYYNRHNPKLYYNKEHINLGDIESYMNNL